MRVAREEIKERACSRLQLPPPLDMVSSIHHNEAQNAMTTIVTVAYEGDRLALLLQAKSLNLHACSAGIVEIIVVENPSPGVRLAWRPELLAAYGHLAPIVRFVSSSDVAVLPKTGGWWTQQVLKLEIARFVRTPDYLLLDAKHHLVKPLLPSFIRNDAGQLRLRGASYVGHPLYPLLQTAFEHFGLPEVAVDFFPTTTPPFPLVRSVALEIKAYAEQHGATTLGEFMVENQLTEFFLYSAYLLASKRIEQIYELHQIPYPVVWKGKSDRQSCEELVVTSKLSESPFFGVHRRAVSDMDAEAMTVLASYWWECRLMPSTKAGLVHLRAMLREQRDPSFIRLKRRIARSFKR